MSANTRFDAILSALLEENVISAEEIEQQRINSFILEHRAEVIRFLKTKYPEEFI